MRTRLLRVFFLAATLAFADAEKKAIIPVDAWPKVVKYEGKTCEDPTIDLCVQQGYRLKQALPVAPGGKQVKSTTWAQDTNDMTRCVAVLVYEDAPPPVIVPPVVLTNVPAARMSFTCTTNGTWTGAAIWLDAPKTNEIKEVKE